MGFLKNPLKVHKKIAKATMPKPGSDPANLLGSGSKKPAVTTKPMQVSVANKRPSGAVGFGSRTVAQGTDPRRMRAAAVAVRTPTRTPPMLAAEGGMAKKTGKKVHCKK